MARVTEIKKALIDQVRSVLPDDTRYYDTISFAKKWDEYPSKFSLINSLNDSITISGIGLMISSGLIGLIVFMFVYFHIELNCKITSYRTMKLSDNYLSYASISFCSICLTFVPSNFITFGWL